MAILAALVWGDMRYVVLFVALSALFDFMDGLSARLLGQYSAIGVQLDSLADMVSFGVVPAVSIYVAAGAAPVLCECGVWGEVLRYVPFAIVACSALRLAKFNIDDTQHVEFCGMPTPANAILCVWLAALCTMGYVTVAREWLALISVVLAALLISPIRMFSFKFSSRGWRGNELRILFLVASLLIIILMPVYSILLIVVLYIVLSTLRWAFGLRAGRSNSEEVK